MWWMCPCTMSAVSLIAVGGPRDFGGRPQGPYGATVELDGNWFHRLAASGKKENFMVLVRQ